MMGYRSDSFLVEMLDVHGIMSIGEGRVFGKGVGRNIHSCENWGRARHMSRGKVAERLTFCAQSNESDMSMARDSNLKMPSSYIICPPSVVVKVSGNR